MKKFEHGGKVFQAAADLAVPVEQIADFSANINPLVDAAKLRQWAAGCWQKALHYPAVDYLELRRALAEYHAISADFIVVDNGATPLIDAVVRALQISRARIVAPTFGEYEKALLNNGVQIEIVDCAADYRVDLTRLFDSVEQTDLIFLCTPNNPTGEQIARRDLVAQLTHLPKTTFCLVDESFLSFTESGERNSMSHLLERFENLIVLRSATKFFAIPGLRMGYALTANAALRDRLLKILPIWRVNCIAETVVVNALGDSAFHAAARAYIGAQRKYLCEQLTALGMVVYPSDANFILFKSTFNLDLYPLLYRRGVLIRRCQNYRGLTADHYRIAVKDEASNRRLIENLKEIKQSVNCSVE